MRKWLAVRRLCVLAEQGQPLTIPLDIEIGNTPCVGTGIRPRARPLAVGGVEEQSRVRAWMKHLWSLNGVVVHRVLVVELLDPFRLVKETEVVHAHEIIGEQASGGSFIFMLEG